MFFFGIDFSITSTSLCIQLPTDEITFVVFPRVKSDQNLTKSEENLFRLLHSCNIVIQPVERKKNIIKLNYADAELGKICDADILSTAISNQVKGTDSIIGLEGLSYGSIGNRLADIAGYQYLLRWKLIKGICSPNQLKVIPPASIKKFATNKGNAKKFEMIDAFKNLTNVQIPLITELNTNPEKFTHKNEYIKILTDIVDSYFIMKYAYMEHHQNSLNNRV